MCSFMRQPSQPIGSTGPTAGHDKLKDYPDHVCLYAGLTEYQTVHFPIRHAALVLKTLTEFLRQSLPEPTYMDSSRYLIQICL